MIELDSLEDCRHNSGKVSTRATCRAYDHYSGRPYWSYRILRFLEAKDLSMLDIGWSGTLQAGTLIAFHAWIMMV